MKAISDFIYEAKNVHGIEEGKVVLVSTRNADAAFLLGESMDQPYDENTVKKICKALGIDFVSAEHDFDDMDPDDVLPGAVYEPGEERIVWYDLLDGTVERFKL